MKKVSFEEIGAVVATFLAGENAKKGQMVGLSAGDTVDGVASVQVSGFARVPCSDAGVTPGWVTLTADGTGGVKKAASGGREYLVVSADADAQTAVVLL